MAEAAALRAPEHRTADTLRTVKIVVHRELIRFWRDRTRTIAGLLQPVLWLLVLGTGLAGLMARGGAHGVDLKTFIFPGVCTMSITITAMSSAGSIVWDREFGFLREMLVAPVSRSAIMAAKCAGGALVATAQGVVILALAGFAGVPYAPPLMLTLLGELFVGAFALTAFGLMMAARLKSMQSYNGLMQMAIMPMIFLSGAMYPVSSLPAWLAVITRVNPLTYIVDSLRQTVFGYLGPVPHGAFNTGVTWAGWRLPVAYEQAMIAVIAIGLLAFAIVKFRRID